MGGGRKGWMAVKLNRRPLGPPPGPRLGRGGGGSKARAPGTEQISQLAIFDVSNAYKKKKNVFFEGYPVGWGGSRGFGSGGVAGRGTGPRDGANFATCEKRKMMFFEGCPVGCGGTHRSWPGGQGGN